jgi:hypothetical protein
MAAAAAGDGSLRLSAKKIFLLRDFFLYDIKVVLWRREIQVPVPIYFPNICVLDLCSLRKTLLFFGIVILSFLPLLRQIPFFISAPDYLLVSQLSLALLDVRQRFFHSIWRKKSRINCFPFSLFLSISQVHRPAASANRS